MVCVTCATDSDGGKYEPLETAGASLTRWRWLFYCGWDGTVVELCVVRWLAEGCFQAVRLGENWGKCWGKFPPIAGDGRRMDETSLVIM